MTTSYQTFNKRRKNKWVGNKWALSLSWPIRYGYLEPVTFSNKSSACTGKTSRPRLQITFRSLAVHQRSENSGCGFDFRELTIRLRFAPRRQTWQWVDWVEYFAFRGSFDRYERTRAHTVRTSSRFLAGTTQPRTH